MGRTEESDVICESNAIRQFNKSSGRFQFSVGYSREF